METKSLSEISCKSVFIGLILTTVFCGANVYLGLKIGNTICASVPSSIIAMILLKLFKNYSVLENTVAQAMSTTADSASIAIFIFPVLLILREWQNIDYWSVVFIGITGGTIGIIYSVILRNILLKDKTLSFPEGHAIARILLSNVADPQISKESSKMLIFGMFISSVLTICQVGLKVLASNYYKIFRIRLIGIVGIGINFSMAIIGAGFLVGFDSTLVSFIAGSIAWLVMLPIFAHIYGFHDSQNIVNNAFYIWQHYTRQVGLGVIIFSGLSAIIMLIIPICHGVKESINALRNLSEINSQTRDLNINKMMIMLACASLLILTYIFRQFYLITNYTVFLNLLFAILLTVLILFIGFITAAVAGYFAGLIGSSNSPVSGLLYISVVTISPLLILIVDFKATNILSMLVMLVAFIGFSSITSNSNIQDYKTGEIVGSTPYKLQIALFIGFTASILIVPLFINLVFNSYGIAGVVPHKWINPNTTLSAPQAVGLALLLTNILHSNQNWDLILAGAIMGGIVLVLDFIGKKTNKFRCNPLSFGFGLYLPLDLVTALFIGGFLRMLINKKQANIAKMKGCKTVEYLHNKSNLLVCGLVAGESLMGIILAIPLLIIHKSDALKVVGSGFIGISQVLSTVVMFLLLYYIYRTATNVKLP